jgi:type VI secretion system Hcp family effector
MTVKCYVKIVGTHQGDFKGDSTDAGHKGAIEGLSADYALTRPLDDSSGHTAGRPQHVPFQIAMLSGPATPQLLQAVLTDEQLKSVTIDFAQPAPKQGQVVEFESILITDAQIVDFQHHLDTDPATAGGRLLDRVALKFHTLQITNTTGKTTAIDTWQ